MLIWLLLLLDRKKFPLLDPSLQSSEQFWWSNSKSSSFTFQFHFYYIIIISFWNLRLQLWQDILAVSRLIRRYLNAHSLILHASFIITEWGLDNKLFLFWIGIFTARKKEHGILPVCLPMSSQVSTSCIFGGNQCRWKSHLPSLWQT